MMATLGPDRETLMRLELPVVLDCCECWALPLRSMIGSSAAPAMRACASACTMRAIATAISRLLERASSMISVNSRERKARHQSSGRNCRLRRNGVARAGTISGRNIEAWLRFVAGQQATREGQRKA